MGKKCIIFVTFLLVSFTGGFYFFYSIFDQNIEHCAFCNPNVLETQKFYEDDLILALYTHKPVLPGHCLVVPKRHVERFESLTNEEISQIGKVIKKVNQAVGKAFDSSSYLILQKNGIEVGQWVPHVHFHYVPRKKGGISTFRFILKMCMANTKGPIAKSEMKKNVDKLKQTIK
ncbi:MAG: HIT family protein [Rhabdochlamydiaceae bacterium]